MRKKILTSEDKEELRYCAECKVSFVEEQNLTDNQKAIARKNIGVSESGGSGGGLSEEELQEAVEDALRQAKESGEFDGYTPVKGVDYFDGKDGKDGTDYVLTDSDKSEIAEEAAKLVDVPSGGGGGNEVYVLSAGETLEDAPEEADIVIDPYAEGDFSDPETDTTLTQPGKAADAEAVGQALAEKIGAEELNTAVSNALTDAKESGLFDGKDGEDGKDGKDGYTPVKDVDYFDGKDGKDGQDGQNGYTPQKGVDYFDGEDGYTPVKGVDYFDGKDGKDGADYVLTDADKAGIAEEAAKLVDVDVPEKLANPHALTFTGAVTGTYDGSEPLNVVIPSGGGGTGGASVELDSTLTEQGKAADAKAVGDALSSKADITTVPNSAIVNADNELVMQRTDGDAVAELFKVALPAGGGGGVGKVLVNVTTEAEVNKITHSFDAYGISDVRIVYYVPPTSDARTGTVKIGNATVVNGKNFTSNASNHGVGIVELFRRPSGCNMYHTCVFGAGINNDHAYGRIASQWNNTLTMQVNDGKMFPVGTMVTITAVEYRGA